MQFANVANLGIPTVTLLDSNCDPTLADWFIPANDDSVSALRLILGSFENAITEGQKRYLNVKHKSFKTTGVKHFSK